MSRILERSNFCKAGRPEVALAIADRISTDYPVPMTSGLLLREARRRAHLSQRALSRRTGVPQPLISAYETGARQPGADMLLRLVRATGHDLALHDTVASSRTAAAKLEQVVGMASGLPARRKPPVRTWADIAG